MSRLWTPFRGLVRVASRGRQSLAIVPQALEAILVLPHMAAQLDRIAANTDALPGMLERLEEVAADTRNLGAVEANTATIASHIPTLVVLERSLPGMMPVLEDLDETVQRLAAVVEPLQGAALRVGRMADRLPQRHGRHPALRG